MGVIIDLDQTIIDSSKAEELRKNRKWKDVYSIIQDFKVYNGFYDYLDTMEVNNIELVIVTSSPTSYCKKVLETHSIKVKKYICYHDTTYHKPHKEPIIEGIKLLSNKEETVISIGDKPNDIIASNSAGAITVGCLWGGDKQLLKKANADYLVNDFPELAELTLKILDK